MKKSLLLSAAIVMAASASAQNDITPSGYYFNTVESFSWAEKAHTGANIGIPAFETSGGEAAWNNGLAVIAGGQFANPNQPYFADLKAGTSLVNLGGEVGQVLCISGVNSKINDKLNELYGVEMNIPSCTGSLNWFNMNFFTDPNNTPTGDENYIRVRVVMNIYANSISADNIVNNAYTVADQGGVRPNSNDSGVSSRAIKSDDFQKYYEDDPETPEEDEDGNPIWDPTRWLVYEFDTTAPESSAEGTSYIPLRLKMEMNQGNLCNATIFIKEITFVNNPDMESSDAIINATQRTYQTLTVNPTPSAIENVEVNEAATYSINGNAVTFSAAANVYSVSGAQVAVAGAGETITLGNGFYVANVGGKSVKFVVK